ncbi:MAG: hypothetical protein JOZ69_05440 [Myxococcales bacterium]|nr:hypothetical protein [Myxococcales bacterium]
MDVAIDHARRVPSTECEIFLAVLGGAAGRARHEATAYPHREARFVMNVHARWRDAADEERERIRRRLRPE